MIVDPDRIPGRVVVDRLGDGGHRLELGDGIVNLDQIEPPPLRHEYTEPNRHSFPPA
jgi:hypothetical protein